MFYTAFWPQIPPQICKEKIYKGKYVFTKKYRKHIYKLIFIISGCPALISYHVAPRERKRKKWRKNAKIWNGRWKKYWVDFGITNGMDGSLLSCIGKITTFVKTTWNSIVQIHFVYISVAGLPFQSNVECDYIILFIVWTDYEQIFLHRSILNAHSFFVSIGIATCALLTTKW